MNAPINYSLTNRRGIVLAADVARIDDARRLAAVVSEVPEVIGIKIGFSLALRHGLSETVKALRQESSLPVIYDHQKAGSDIPQMGRPFAEVCREAGIDAVIIFGQAGPRTLEAFAAGALEAGLLPIIGLTMSHPEYLVSEGGYVGDETPARICALALRLGLSSFVLPGNKPHLVARLCIEALSGVNGVTVFMPGIGSQGGDLPAAFDAVTPHTPVAIIGSAIYASPKPRQALSEFVRALKR